MIVMREQLQYIEGRLIMIIAAPQVSRNKYIPYIGYFLYLYDIANGDKKNYYYESTTFSFDTPFVRQTRQPHR